MRPLRLTMQAFGSYGERTVIDFTMPNQNLFLVTGDTGSGKTTIFEAIVFALYGKSAGDKTGKNGKTGMDLQSQYVGRDVTPFVELKFSDREGSSERFYVVTRIPQHERKLLRKSRSNPEGIRVDSESVTMLRLEDADSEEGTPVAQSMVEINRKIEEIVGLSREQFMQVAMIAQGKFMDMLRSGTEERKKIFSHLFGTGIYQKITDETSGRLRRMHGRNQSLLEVCRQTVAQTVIPESEGELPAKLREEKEEIAGMERFAVKRLADFSEDLTALVEDLEQQKRAADDALAAASGKRDQAREEFARAESLALAYRQLEEAEQTLKRCRERTDEIDEKQRLLGTIGKSFEILAAKRNADDAEKNYEETVGEIRSLGEKLPVFQREAQEAKTRADASEAERDHASSSLASVKEKAERARRVFEAIRKAEQEAEKREQDAKTASDLADQAAGELKKIEEKETAALETVQKLSGAEAALEKAEALLSDGEKLSARAADLRREAEENENAHRKADALQERYRMAARKYNEALLDYRKKRSVYFDNIAGVLASDLREGAPCPVCGSTSHPHLAALGEDAGAVTKQDLDQLERSVGRMGEDQERLSLDAGSGKAAADERSRRLIADTGEFIRNLTAYRDRIRLSAGGNEEDYHLSEIPEPLSRESLPAVLECAEGSAAEMTGAARVKRDEAGRSEQMRQSAEKEAESCKKKKEQLRSEADRRKEEAGRAQTAAAESLAVLNNVRKSDTGFGTKEEADRAEQIAREEADGAERKLRAARAEERGKKTRADRTAALLADRREELPGLMETFRRTKDDYRRAMEERGLSEAEWKDVIERYPDERQACDALRKEIGDYREEKSGAERVKAAAEQSIGGRSRPDLNALEETRRKTEEHFQAASAAAGEADRILQADKAAQSVLAGKLQEGQTSMRREEQLSHLYNVLAGKVSGSRMDVETFVQRYYLERILRSANVRFREMSMGQFELRMVDLDRAGEGRNRGLDLTVYSYVTGTEREVRTLSGGESFMAALSLALGLADQITAGSSSIHLDMMFIDEGFGTLDDRAREQAVRTLRKMAGGSKLIGIISHVTELKQEMEDQLIVYKDENGSHVRWQIS